MNLDTWEMSGALTRVGELAQTYAKRYNDSRMTDGLSDRLSDHFIDELSGCRDAVRCFNGFSLEWDCIWTGEIERVYITYKGAPCGMPWILKTRGKDYETI